MFDSLKITTSYLSFYCFLVFQTVLKNVKNFRESYVFHCLVIKVVCLRLSADNSFIISLAFCFVKNFFILFFKFFFICISNSDIISCLQFPVNTFFIFFFNFIQPNLCCLSKKSASLRSGFIISLFSFCVKYYFTFFYIFFTPSPISL